MEVTQEPSPDTAQSAASRSWPRIPRLIGMAVLMLYGVLLTLASLELVPLPASLSTLSGLAGDAATATRRVGLVPGLPLFHDRDRTPIGVLANCVEIIGVQPDGSEQARYATSTCREAPGSALLRGPLDKALVRLHFDALVFRDVPPSGWPASGDRILGSIGHQYCRRPASTPPEEVRFVWSQAVEHRGTGRRDAVARGAARWSCEDQRLIARGWQPSFDAATASASSPTPLAWPDP